MGLPTPPIDRKRATEWLLHMAFLLAGLLAMQWWQRDIDAKDLYTREWHATVERHIARTDAEQPSYIAIKAAIPEISKQLADLNAKVDELRQFVAREQGRREAGGR